MMSQEERQNIRRIAIVRALHLGDLLLAVPSLRAIRAGFPAAEITLIGLPWSRDFVRRFAHYIDRWREFPGYPGLLEVDPEPQKTELFLREEQAYRYDLVIQMHGSGNASNPFALALGGARTIGYYDGVKPDGLSIGTQYPSTIHEVDRDLGLARLLGLPTTDRRLEFPVLLDDEAALATLLPAEVGKRRPLIGLHVGARPPARRWATNRFAAVGDDLVDRYEAQIVVTGGPGEDSIAEAVLDAMSTPAINLAGRTDIGCLAALIKRCDLFISNDTGPAHVAVAVDTPSITIFGPADRRRWAPLDQSRHPIAFQSVGCSPCPHWECPIDHRCLRWIEPRQVLQLADQLLAGYAFSEDRKLRPASLSSTVVSFDSADPRGEGPRCIA